MSVQDDLNDLVDRYDALPEMTYKELGTPTPIPNHKMNDNLYAVSATGDISLDATQIALDAANGANEAKQSAETLLALVTGTVDLPDFTVPNAPLMVNSTETGVIFGDTSVYEVRDSLAALPDIKPVLMADFANSRQVDGRFEFSRNSEDYRDGRVYVANEPVVTEQGLWVSGERTNLFRWSDDLENGVWVKDRVSVAKEGVFFKLSATGEVGNAYLGQAVPATPSSLISFSASFKKNSGFVALETLNYASQDGGGTLIGFDSSDGSFNTIRSGSGLPITVLDEGGSYRVSISTRTTPTSTGAITFSTSPTNSKGEISTSPKAQGLSIDVSFYQAEIGAATPYIPTEGSQVTVAGVTRASTKKRDGIANKLSFYAELSDLMDTTEEISANSRRHIIATETSAQDGRARFSCYIEGNVSPYTFGFVFYDRNSSQPQTLNVANIDNLINVKVGAVIKNNELIWAVNGVSGSRSIVFTDGGANTEIMIGKDFGVIRYLRGYLSKINFYDHALTAQQLQELTS